MRLESVLLEQNYYRFEPALLVLKLLDVRAYYITAGYNSN